MTEEWRQIPGYEGRYDASNKGRIRSHVAPGVPLPHIMSPCIGSNPYLQLRLRDGQHKVRNFFVHVLVCLAWHGPKPFDEAQVRHLDCDTYNNKSCNLTWGTIHENAQDSLRAGNYKVGEQHYKRRASDEVVREIRASSLSYHRLAECYDLHWVTVRDIKKHKTWKHVA